MLRFILCHARRPVSCPSTNPLFAGSNPAPPPLPGMQEVSSLSVKLEAKSALHTELRNRAGHLSAEALRATEEERERSGEVQRAASVHQDALRAVEDINQRVRGGERERAQGRVAGLAAGWSLHSHHCDINAPPSIIPQKGELAS